MTKHTKTTSVAVIALLALLCGAAFAQSDEAKLIETYTPEHHCQDDLYYLDKLLSALEKDADGVGFAVVSPGKENWTYAQVVLESLKRNIADYEEYQPRIVLVRSPAVSQETKVSLWIAPKGVSPPAPSEAKTEAVDPWSLDISGAKNPFIFNEHRSDEYSGCFEDDFPVYADVLKANPEARGNIVIYAYSRARFEKRKKELISRLSAKGIGPKRIRTFYVYEKGLQFEMGRYVGEPELWILP